MNDLSNSIYDYYWQHFHKLPFDKQFHFASRLYLWQRDETAMQKLQALRADFSAQEQPQLALQQVAAAAQQTTSHGSKNAAGLRAPYFAKYPDLKTSVSVLFRINFLYTVYQIDTRQDFKHLFAADKSTRLAEDLLVDAGALAALSTHAINYIYLYRVLVIGTTQDPQPFYAIGQTCYNLDQPVQLQLLIYLYTHCIIGESQFYARPITKNRSIYSAMVAYLEQLIDDHFADINLDNKFEFLVCCQLLNYHSTLRERIDREAAQSLSENGTFLIDRHNNNPQSQNIAIDNSEHRNVLYIMAQQPFKPLYQGR